MYLVEFQVSRNFMSTQYVCLTPWPTTTTALLPLSLYQLYKNTVTAHTCLQLQQAITASPDLPNIVDDLLGEFSNIQRHKQAIQDVLYCMQNLYQEALDFQFNTLTHKLWANIAFTRKMLHETIPTTCIVIESDNSRQSPSYSPVLQVTDDYHQQEIDLSPQTLQSSFTSMWTHNTLSLRPLPSLPQLPMQPIQQFSDLSPTPSHCWPNPPSIWPPLTVPAMGNTQQYTANWSKHSSQWAWDWWFEGSVLTWRGNVVDLEARFLENDRLLMVI